MAAIAVVPLPMQLSRITPPRFAVSADKIADKFDGLLGGMEHGGFMLFLDADNTHGKLLARSCRLHLAYLLVVVVGSPALELAVAAVGFLVLAVSLRMTWCADGHLRVIDRQRLVEHGDILMASKRHAVGIKEACRAALVPDEIVPPELRLRHHQLCREHSLAEQQDGPIVLDDALVLFP